MSAIYILSFVSIVNVFFLWDVRRQVFHLFPVFRSTKEGSGELFLLKMRLFLLLLGLFLLSSSSTRAEPELQEDEEEESSCQGAFDLYFVLDK